MKCENLQFNLSIYTDDALTEDERASVDAHLAQCPVCRQKLADFQELRNNLRVLSRPEIPVNVLNSVRTAVSSSLGTNEIAPLFLFPRRSQSWIQAFLMPYSVGAAASVFLGFIFLGILLSGASDGPRSEEFASIPQKYARPVMLSDPKLSDNENFIFDSSDIPLGSKDFARERLSVSGESPSVNPTGALVALTKSLVRGEMKDEEVVVVADVFGNGLARIAEVIEQPRDRQTLYNLEKALRTDPDFAPFVPASFDGRADSVQIVLKIQRVDVDVKNRRPRNRK
jgi:hypothetical protein